MKAVFMCTLLLIAIIPFCTGLLLGTIINPFLAGIQKTKHTVSDMCGEAVVWTIRGKNKGK